MSWNMFYLEIPTGRSKDDHRLGPTVGVNHPYKGNILMPPIFRIQSRTLCCKILREQQLEMNFWLEVVYTRFFESQDEYFGEIFLTTSVYLSSLAAKIILECLGHGEQLAIPVQATQNEFDVSLIHLQDNQNSADTHRAVGIVYENIRHLLSYSIHVFAKMTSVHQDSRVVQIFAAVDEDRKLSRRNRFKY